jgi:hypothetical protein
MNQPIVIPCASRKLKTNVPVRAYQLYKSTFFYVRLKVASTLSADVRILSAGYGLLLLNDMVLPYEKKMDEPRALALKQAGLTTLDEYSHFLPPAYLKAMTTIGQPLIRSGLGIGDQAKAAMALIKRTSRPLVDFPNMVDGLSRDLISPNEIVRWDAAEVTLPGPCFGVCIEIGDMFEHGLYSIEECAQLLLKRYGPPSRGDSYAPTVNRQLREQAKWRNHVIYKKRDSGTRKYSYTYQKALI